MSDLEFKQLVAAWSRFSKMTEQEHADGIPKNEFHYWEKLHSLILSSPGCAWDIIAAVAEDNNAANELAYIAAGPLEELLIQLGDGAENFFKTRDRDYLEQLLPYIWIEGLAPQAKNWVIGLRGH